MEGYLIWLACLVLAIAAMSVIQLLIGSNRRLQMDCRRMEGELRRLEDEIREREGRIDRLSHEVARLWRLRERASELERELRSVKQAESLTSDRQRFLEEDLAGDERVVRFICTFQPAGINSFEGCLHRMLEGAGLEVVLVSPWIKRQTWERLSPLLGRIIRMGGRLVVFTRGRESDYELGLSDDLREEIKGMGGEVVTVDQLHAKIYMVDRREAIVSSSNLTRGGVESNYEAGVWVIDPGAIRDICRFIDRLRQEGS
ncbi:MAG: phospholipase D-like domain-containing protein [Methanothrix sp.]|nr:phospholipase D-like domain-containing protein [Methanothrix sp.]